jgi:hypothetical protein
MSNDPDDNTAAKNYNRRLAQELAELDDPLVKKQLQLDHWWQAQRDFDWEEDDVYECGGYLERWSQTPSYTKSRRDRDFKVR